MKLHGSQTSPYVRKVRVALSEADIPFAFAVCDVWRSDSHIPDLNPLGKVPVLEIGDGEILFDSFVIIDFLDRMTDGRFIPAEGVRRREALLWHAIAHGIIDAASAEVRELRRPPELQSASFIARERERTARALDAAEKAVASGAFPRSDTFALADVTLAVALQYLDFRIRAPWRDDHPALREWLTEAGQRTSLLNSHPPSG